MVVALVAGAALAHAAWNVAIKRAGTSGATFLWIAFVIGAIAFAPFGIASLVEAGVSLAPLLVLATVSGLIQVLYFSVLQRGYRLGDVSVVYPLARGTGPLLSVVLAVVVLGERPSLIGLVGASTVVIGVVVIGLAGGREKFAGNRTGVLYGLLVGVIIALFTLWDATAVIEFGMPPVGYYWLSVVVQAIAFAVPALLKPSVTAATARAHWRAAVIVGVLGPLAYMLILTAFQLAPVSLVAPAREVSVVLVGLAGWLLFKEPNPVQRLVGAVIVLLGVGMLAVG